MIINFYILSVAHSVINGKLIYMLLRYHLKSFVVEASGRIIHNNVFTFNLHRSHKNGATTFSLTTLSMTAHFKNVTALPKNNVVLSVPVWPILLSDIVLECCNVECRYAECIVC